MNTRYFETAYDYSENVTPDRIICGVTFSATSLEKENTPESESNASKACDEAIGTIRNVIVEPDKIKSMHTTIRKSKSTFGDIAINNKKSIFKSKENQISHTKEVTFSIEINIDDELQSSLDRIRAILEKLYALDIIGKKYEASFTTVDLFDFHPELKDVDKAYDELIIRMSAKCSERATLMAKALGTSIKSIQSVVYNTDGKLINNLNTRNLVQLTLPKQSVNNASFDTVMECDEEYDGGFDEGFGASSFGKTEGFGASSFGKAEGFGESRLYNKTVSKPETNIAAEGINLDTEYENMLKQKEIENKNMIDSLIDSISNEKITLDSSIKVVYELDEAFSFNSSEEENEGN